ncbi:MAG TPA: adenylate/guanylate cyclase domain-containing protein [Usitatibacter sp.]|nr:adenylate/guanylate cyclase domain-containing protein [Usitatibacter sp.]
MAERTPALPWRTVAAIAACVAALFAGLSFTGPWQLLEDKGFDALTVATAAGQSRIPITIVGVDEASLAQLGRQYPWPRSLYAQLIDQLTKSGALLVALDVLFSEPSTPAEDRALAEAIARDRNVVLVSNLVYRETAHSRQWLRADPLPMFTQAGATSGFASVEFDPDQVVRNIPEGDDAFWREILRRAARKIPDLLAVRDPGPGAMIRYVGPEHTFPYVSFYQALDAEHMLPPDAFRDQIVLVGRELTVTTDLGIAQADFFATPFTARNRGLMPGVEIHANSLETAVLGNAIHPLSRGWSVICIFAVTALCALAMRNWRPLPAAAIAVAIAAALGLGDWLVFTRADAWLPVGSAMASAVAAYVAIGGVAFLAERQRRGEIRRAFSLYVSPEVVDHVMEHPERLKLGGERREVTTMFTDLEGFTTLAERLEAEQVARVLNLHFTRGTAIVKRHGGTVNRFIGDAIMATWGAPLADPDQALHACRAATEMQDDMEAQRAELARQGLPPIRMRIGIHTSVAVVGNLGSSDRFDYTSIGDGVNLASRLEGVNKAYGTGILLSGETAERLGGRLPVRAVGRVIVKGKSEAVEIFTPCADAALAETSARALAAWRERRWDESEALWRRILADHPADGIARVYLERIAAVRSAAPDGSWHDAVELEKL